MNELELDVTEAQSVERRRIARAYFEEHPDEKGGVMRAYFAYHVTHFRLDPKGHNFTNCSRETKCVWCGRSREMVRHDDLSPECQKRPEIPDLADVIRGEEEKAWKLFERAESDVPKLVSKMGMSGETLAVLHHTHGYDPETVAVILNVPPQMMADYYAAMEVERSRSRRSQKREMVLSR